MVVHELLLGQCCDCLFAIVAVKCMPLCVIYSIYYVAKSVVLVEGKQLGGEDVSFKYPG